MEKLAEISKLALIFLATCLAHQCGCLQLKDILPPYNNGSIAYDKLSSPREGLEPTLISVAVHLLRLTPKQPLFEAEIFLTQRWRDERLRLPQEEAEKSDFVALDHLWIDNIWRPDTYVEGANHMDDSSVFPSSYLLLHKNKTVEYQTKFLVNLRCDSSNFGPPFETHFCDILIKSITGRFDHTTYEWDKEVENPFSVEKITNFLPNMDMYSHYSEGLHPSLNAGVIGKVSYLMATIYLEVHVSYFWIRVFIPVCALLALSWIPFWMQPEDCMFRLAVGSTSLIALLIHILSSEASFPRTSRLKLIDFFFFVNFMLVLLAFAETCVVKYWMTGDTYRDVEEQNNVELNVMPSQQVSRETAIPRSRIQAIKYDHRSRVAFPVTFCAFSIIIFLIYLHYHIPF